MSTRKVFISVLECQCEKCLNAWVTLTNQVPKFCPACGSTKWNEPSETLPNDSNDAEELLELEIEEPAKKLF